MKLTANIKLQCSKEQHQILLQTLETCNKACNYISQICFDKKVFGQFKVHKLIYKEIRKDFELSSQIAIRCIAKIADAYKLDKKILRDFKPYSSQPFDDRNFRLMKNDQISITTTDGRLKIPFICGDYQRKLLQTRKGEVDLMYIEGQFYIACTCEIDEAEIKDPTGILGIDLGIVNIAVDSEGEHYSGKQIEVYRKKFYNRRKNLQRKGSRSAKKKLKKISAKQSRFQKDTNHCISKAIVAKAQRLSFSISLEDLKGIREGVKVRKSQRAKMANWGFYQLKSFIEYKAKRFGILVAVIDPRNTSRTCPKCKFVSKKNRPTRDRFCCKQCGFCESADFVAAWNIQAKADVNQPMVAGMASGSL